MSAFLKSGTWPGAGDPELNMRQFLLSKNSVWLGRQAVSAVKREKGNRIVKKNDRTQKRNYLWLGKCLKKVPFGLNLQEHVRICQVGH